MTVNPIVYRDRIHHFLSRSYPFVPNAMPQTILRAKAKSAHGRIKQELKNQGRGGARREAQSYAAVGYSGMNTNSKPRDQFEVGRVRINERGPSPVPIIAGRPMQSV
jgi:hypothetical protein